MSVTMQDAVRSQRPKPLGTRVDDAVLAKRAQRSRLRLITSPEVNALAPPAAPTVAFAPSPAPERPLSVASPEPLGPGGLVPASEGAGRPAAPLPPAVVSRPAVVARPGRAAEPPRHRPVPEAPVAREPAARTRLAYRLTLRGQRVAVAAGFLLAVLLGGAVGTVLGSGDPVPVPTDTITVQAGDTLWSIAGGIVPSGDLRPVMDQIRDLNGIEGSAISTGQKLLVPVP